MDVNAITLSTASPRTVGEAFNIGVLLKLPSGGPIYNYYLTGTVDIYDSSGTITAIANQPLTATPLGHETIVRATYMLYTGTGRPITTADTYRAVYTVKMSDNSISSWEQYLILSPKPY